MHIFLSKTIYRPTSSRKRGITVTLLSVNTNTVLYIQNGQEILEFPIKVVPPVGNLITFDVEDFSINGFQVDRIRVDRDITYCDFVPEPLVGTTQFQLLEYNNDWIVRILGVNGSKDLDIPCIQTTENGKVLYLVRQRQQTPVVFYEPYYQFFVFKLVTIADYYGVMMPIEKFEFVPNGVILYLKEYKMYRLPTT